MKIVHNKYDACTVSHLFSLHESSSTRGHKLKIQKKLTQSKQFHCFFTNRVVNYWNDLECDTVSVSSVNAFKNKIDAKFKRFMFTTELHQFM